jgi:hypothetical protein
MEGSQQKPKTQNIVKKLLCKMGLHRWYWSKGITAYDKGKINPRRVELYLCRNNCFKTKQIG